MPTATLTATFLLVAVGSIRAQEEHVATIRELPVSHSGVLYPANRAPLVPSPLIKLPIGAITPKGWLRHQLELERDGMTGHLAEISRYCKFEGNAWADSQGHGHSGWEDLPYWLRGYGDLGYVLKDQSIISAARRWLEAVLASQESDGWFGPRDNKIGEAPYFPKQRKPAPDMWPNMLILQAMESWYENTGDSRILPFMTRYFRWQLNCPKRQFLVAPFDNVRRGDNLASVYWLYNRTGEPWLLELATKLHECGSANWTAGLAGSHGVNLSQGFREPGEYYMQAGQRKYLDAAVRNYETIMDTYGQFPGGGFAADESCRPGCVDPRQGFETCSWVELMHSFEMLTKISGDPVWADRCEEIAFNSLPAAMTPDLKGLHYLTAANQVQLDEASKAPGIGNDGAMFPYSPHWYTCCQHNVSHGWPYYAEELWLATSDRGLCVSLYSASEVTAKVGDGSEVTIVETTDYPFRDTVELKVRSPAAVRFPLYLRIPRWCANPEVRINGRDISVACAPLSYLRIERTWKSGDVVSVRLPMTLGVRTWAKNKNAVSVYYGPLAFSLKIGEKWSEYGGTSAWPNFEVFPTTSWNYGLMLDAKTPEASFQLVHSSGSLAPQTIHTRNGAASTEGQSPPDSRVGPGRSGIDQHVAVRSCSVGRASRDCDADPDGRGTVADQRLSEGRRWPRGSQMGIAPGQVGLDLVRQQQDAAETRRGTHAGQFW